MIMNSLFFKFQGFLKWLQIVQSNFEEIAAIDRTDIALNNLGAATRHQDTLHHKENKNEPITVNIQGRVYDNLEDIKYKVIDFTP